MNLHLIKNIVALVATIVIVPTDIFSNIIYTDLRPDITRSCEALFTTCIKSYGIDIDQDGTNDYEMVDHIIFIYGVGEEMVKVRTLGNNQVDVDRTDLYARALSKNSVISSAERWAVDTSWGNVLSETTGGPYSGHWENNTARFLGIRLKKGSHYYYGWIRMAVLVKTNNGTGTAAFRVFDYAVNDVPDEPILAGRSSGGLAVSPIAVDHLFAETINEDLVLDISPNPVRNGILNVICKSIYPVSADLIIVNMNGKPVYREKSFILRPGTSTLNLSTLPAGYYYLKAITKNKQQSIKFLKIE